MRALLAMEQDAVEDERVVDAEGNERRRAFRRRLPFGRGAVLKAGGRTHIVGLADVSVTGAYLTTRAAVEPGEIHVLRVLLFPDTVETELRVQVVRVSLQDHEPKQHPRGVAVRFLELDAAAERKLKAFIGQRLPHKRRPQP
jgi:c-di-GMP-binding flagellar brake protein YcgR